MKTTTIALFAAALLATPALAQSMPKVAGTVQKIDESAEKITIKHGPIPNLDMGEMTMVFRAGNKDVLKEVKAGDKVQFTADRVNGQLTVTSIQKTK
ncbi:copper-binding protein [Alsobacter sp. SYSU M60028]|uniref:Copper-binding protein n=1 Tax=Alsobacter ponti TaxID=2962936 RepID=A0ABT1LFV3_9HYPH|nr:copper-binding protein [Alsobacter ponti]MCP8940380.1 copper-binding protein [Alsobacter ponti]